MGTQFETMDLEKVYDEEIAPLMEKIIAICKEHKLPVFATFEFAPSEFCSTLIPAPWAHPVFKHLNAIRQSVELNGVNLDKYMMWVMKEVGVGEHSSIILKQLGM